jgi:hypothetical protein
MTVPQECQLPDRRDEVIANIVSSHDLMPGMVLADNPNAPEEVQIETALSTLMQVVSTLNDKPDRRDEVIANIVSTHDLMPGMVLADNPNVPEEVQIETELSTLMQVVSTLNDKPDRRDEVIANIVSSHDLMPGMVLADNPSVPEEVEIEAALSTLMQVVSTLNDKPDRRDEVQIEAALSTLMQVVSTLHDKPDMTDEVQIETALSTLMQVVSTLNDKPDMTDEVMLLSTTASSASLKLASSTEDPPALKFSQHGLLSPSSSESSLCVVEQADTRVIGVEEHQFQEYEHRLLSAAPSSQLGSGQPSTSQVCQEDMNKLATCYARAEADSQAALRMPDPPLLSDVTSVAAQSSGQNASVTVFAQRNCTPSSSKWETTSPIPHRRTISVGDVRRMQSAPLTAHRQREQNLSVTPAHPLFLTPQRTSAYSDAQQMTALVNITVQQSDQRHINSFNHYAFMESQRRRFTSSMLSTQMVELEGWWEEVNRNIPFERLPTDGCVNGRKVMQL